MILSKKNPTNSAGELDIHDQKTKRTPDLSLISHTNWFKIGSTDLNINHETTNIRRRKSSGSRVDKKCSDLILKTESIKGKIVNKLDFIKILNLLNKTSLRRKRQATFLGEYLQTTYPAKDWILRIYEKTLNCNPKEINNPIRKQKKRLEWIFHQGRHTDGK